MFGTQGAPRGDRLCRQSFDWSRNVFSAALASDDEAARRRRSMEHETSIGEQKANIYSTARTRIANQAVFDCDSIDILSVLL